jgi:hypothetical protein
VNLLSKAREKISLGMKGCRDETETETDNDNTVIIDERYLIR